MKNRRLSGLILMVIVALIVLMETSTPTAKTAVSASVGFANPVNPLPSDNLIDFDSAWMRKSDSQPGSNGYPSGAGNWVDETGNLALSRGVDKNPSPDKLDGTAMQFDGSVITADPLMAGQDAWVSLLVAAPGPHATLKFAQWRVLRNGGDTNVNIHGCDANGENCQPVWSPVSDKQSSKSWEFTGVRETAVSQSFPTYKIFQHCQYIAGTAGCKLTGFYFAVESDAPDPPLSTATKTTAPPTLLPPTETAVVPPDDPELITDTARIPLPDLGVNSYMGEQGGLYANGLNEVPADYQTAEINPVYTALENDNNIVLLCLGMSNLTWTCGRFAEMFYASPSTNKNVTIINAGWPGAAQQRWDSKRPFDRALKVLTQNGLTPEDVDLALYFNACAKPANNGCKKYPAGFPLHAKNMKESLEITMELINSNYQNVQLVYVTSREFAGFATVDLNPEPFAYEEGFAFKWLVQDRIDGNLAGAPLLWWAYQYDPSWPQSYFYADGTHLSNAGLDVVGQLWLDHCLSLPWCTNGIAATSTPHPVSTETAVPTQPSTPYPNATGTPTLAPTKTAVPTMTPTSSAPAPTPCSGWSIECLCEQQPELRICTQSIDNE